MPTATPPTEARVAAVAPIVEHTPRAAAPLVVPAAPRSRRGAIAAALGLAAVVAIAFVATRGDSTPSDDRIARQAELAPTQDPPTTADPREGPASADTVREPTEPPTPTVITVPSTAPTPTPTPIVAAAAPSDPGEPPSDAADDPIVESTAVPTVVASDESAAELLRRANESRRAGRTKEGLALYKQAVAIEPRNVEALSAITRIYFDRGSFAEAVSWGKRVVDAEPSSAKARLALGDAYFKLGKLAQAEAQYRKADKLGHRLAESRLAAVRTSP
jgi:hypothetical protein